MNALGRFTVPGLAVPQGSMKPVRQGSRLGVQPNNKRELESYRARVAMSAQAAEVRYEPKGTPVSVEIRVVLPRPQAHFGTGRNAGVLKDSAPRYPVGRPDGDKIARAVLDALTGVAYADDSQVVLLSVDKTYAQDSEAPCTRVEVMGLADRRPA